MRKYEVVASYVNEDYIWNVYETTTRQVIESFYFEDDAEDMAKFLEYGGAFDGFTPAFMLNKFPIGDINAKFQHLIS